MATEAKGGPTIPSATTVTSVRAGREGKAGGYPLAPSNRREAQTVSRPFLEVPPPRPSLV